jgi:DNA replication and repair protein RecF
LHVHALQLAGFRNLAPVLFQPQSLVTVFWGDNAQGKTNLLEALYVLGTLRSFRTQRLRELVQFGQPSAVVQAQVEKSGTTHQVELRLDASRKALRLDGKTPRSLPDYFGAFNVVLFAPEDLRVLRGAPVERRRFLDRSVFNRQVQFLGEAQTYARVLKTRNTLLREGGGPDDLLEVYTTQLAQAGARVVAARRRYLAEILPELTVALAAIAGSDLALGLSYLAPDAVVEAGDDAAQVRTALEEELRKSRARDVVRRQSTVGPHVDDVEFLLAGKPAREYASQGQLRALVLAWKTAEMRLLERTLGDCPVLLLDDVSSELDPTRNEFFFRFLSRIACQCFVTTTHGSHLPVTENRSDFQIVGGVIGGVN